METEPSAPGDRPTAVHARILREFRAAVAADDEIIVHFHPIIDLRTGKVHGAEALVRWQHPQIGLLQPAAFLEAVEQTALIETMTAQVLDRALAACAEWHADGRELQVYVNLAARNLYDPMLSSCVLEVLRRHRVPARYLTLEITESMVLRDPQPALAAVETLRGQGVRFAIDDYGTGHSALANLRRLPVHELKIDRSFVTPMLSDARNGAMVRSTIELGHALELKIAAEAVEDESTWTALREMDCDYAQGYYFAKPLSPRAFLPCVMQYERSPLR